MSDASEHPANETREALLEAALACFSKYGYDATSIRLIASMAGKNSSLIAYYFKGKEGLYREVFKFIIQRFAPANRANLQAPPFSAPEAHDPAWHALRRIIHIMLQDVQLHLNSKDPLRKAAVRLFLDELHAPKGVVGDLLQEHLEPEIRELRKCVHAIRPDFSPAETDFWGITIQGTCINHALLSEFNHLVWTEVDTDLEIETMSASLTEFAFQGLRHAQAIA